MGSVPVQKVFLFGMCSLTWMSSLWKVPLPGEVPYRRQAFTCSKMEFQGYVLPVNVAILDCWIGGLKLKTPSFWILIKSLEKVGVNHYVITIPLLPRDFTSCWSLLLNLNECSFKSWTSRGGGMDEKGLGIAVCLGKWEGFGFEVFQIHVGVTILY